MRLIDADALKVDYLFPTTTTGTKCYQYVSMEQIQNAPTIEPEPHWVPVTERLPEAECGESESVLVCFENGTQDVLYFNGGNWCYPTGETYISRNYKNGWHNEVAAWMPLPEPWKGEQHA